MSFFPPLTPLIGGELPPDTPPSGDWPTCAPEDVGMDGAKIRAIRTLGDAVLIRFGKLFHQTGDPMRPRGWASSARGIVAAPCHATAVSMGLYPAGALDRRIQDLPSHTAQVAFPEGLTLAQAVGYLSVHNEWYYSRWWREMDNVFLEVTGRTLHDFFNQELAPLIPGLTASVEPSDGTPRVSGSPYNAARWGAFMLAQGMGKIDPPTFARATAPGPYDLEAWGGFHLVNHGRLWETPRELQMPGVPDFTIVARSGGKSQDAVCVVPAYQLIVAAKSGSSTPADYLPAVCSAVVQA